MGALSWSIVIWALILYLSCTKGKRKKETLYGGI